MRKEDRMGRKGKRNKERRQMEKKQRGGNEAR